jgi:serine/threonine protein phosphatase PrpC
MRLDTHTEPGGKLLNEDYLIARRHPQSSDGYICLLADGQGGQSNGALAAKAACETAWRLASESSFDSLLNISGWQEILAQADLAALTTGGFTTLIAIALNHDLASGASSGDCKAYFTQPNQNHDLTEWTRHQRRNPPVGSGEADFVPFLAHSIANGRLLIVSDGVWKYCGYEALRSATQTPDPASAITLLRTAVLQNSGSNLPDDFTVIAITIS